MKFPRLQVLAVMFAACFIETGSAVRGGLGEGCTDYNDCQHLGGLLVECRRNICSCIPTAFVVANMCVPKKYLGSSCMMKEECYVAEGSTAKPECNANRCSCPSDHKSNEDNTKCTLKVGLGEGCKNQEDCQHLGGSQVKCEGYICSCIPTAVVEEKKCVENSGVRNTLSILSIVVFTALAKIMS